LAKLNSANNVFDVGNAVKLLYGKSPMLRNITNNIGLNYGSLKAIQSGDCANYQTIAVLNYNALISTG
jgi:hypothetical protein